MASPSTSPSPASPTALPHPHPQSPSNDPPMATPLSLLVPVQSQPQPLPLPAPPSSRRLPPPCWTPEETSALIDAYMDKWYSLRRGNLRAAHWEEVSNDLHRRCPHAALPKTPVQCRHKMEKLRKRYRAELQRAKSIPHHRFSSSWVYFSKMDSMEKGPTAAAPNSSPFSLSSPPHLATVVAAAPTNDSFHDEVSDDDDDEDNNYDPRRDLYHRNGFKIKIAANSRNPSPNPNPNFGYKSKYGSINKFNSSPSPQFEDGVRYASAATTRMANGSGSRMNMGMGMDMDVDDDLVMLMRKKKKSGLGKRERESRGEDAGLEMVEAIRVLGEGFVRMEKMKMEMMRETERMRMEMEMKRTEMILDSQHRIVEAFAKTWADAMTTKKDPSC